MGRALGNNMINLTCYKGVKEALDELGFDLNAIEDEEPDAALGNAGRTPLRPQKSGKRHRSGKE